MSLLSRLGLVSTPPPAPAPAKREVKRAIRKGHLAEAQRTTLEAVEPLLREAERLGFNLYCPTNGICFTPAQLKDAQAAGRFIWGPRWFRLVSPETRPATYKPSGEKDV